MRNPRSQTADVCAIIGVLVFIAGILLFGTYYGQSLLVVGINIIVTVVVAESIVKEMVESMKTQT